MPEEKERQQLYQALFVQLVFSLHTATMQHLGKLPNPLTNKIERSLDQARVSIDMLDMLKEKTAGNLSDEEKRLLDRLISECKLNFVDEMAREEKERAAKKEEVAEAPEKQPEGEAEEQPAEAASSGQAEPAEEKVESGSEQPQEAEGSSKVGARSRSAKKSKRGQKAQKDRQA